MRRLVSPSAGQRPPIGLEWNQLMVFRAERRLKRLFAAPSKGKRVTKLRRFFGRLAELRHYYLVRKFGLFDSRYYRTMVGRHVRFPLFHFLMRGGASGLSPHPLFDSDWYLTYNQGIKSGSTNPLVHYLIDGKSCGHDPNPYFNTKWYLDKNGDVARATINPLVHYLKHGAAEGRDPSRRFVTEWYVRTNPDVCKTGINPLSHFLSHGRSKRRLAHPGITSITSMSNIVVARDGSFEFVNDDPQFQLSLMTEEYRNQVCLVLSLDFDTVKGEHHNPSLYVDYGDGYSEADAFYLRETGKDHASTLKRSG
jgi:hypothetical protein